MKNGLVLTPMCLVDDLQSLVNNYDLKHVLQTVKTMKNLRKNQTRYKLEVIKKEQTRISDNGLGLGNDTIELLLRQAIGKDLRRADDFEKSLEKRRKRSKPLDNDSDSDLESEDNMSDDTGGRQSNGKKIGQNKQTGKTKKSFKSSLRTQYNEAKIEKDEEFETASIPGREILFKEFGEMDKEFNVDKTTETIEVYRQNNLKSFTNKLEKFLEHFAAEAGENLCFIRAIGGQERFFEHLDVISKIESFTDYRNVITTLGKSAKINVAETDTNDDLVYALALFYAVGTKFLNKNKNFDMEVEDDM